MRTFFVQPRQIGKTTFAMYEYMKDPDGTLFVTFNMRAAKDIMDQLKSRGCEVNSSNFISSASLNKFDFKDIRTVILDEYLFFKDTVETYSVLNMYPFINVLVYSTPKKQYDIKLYEFIKSARSMRLPAEKTKELLNLSGLAFSEEDFHELYFNFLTDPNVDLVTTKLSNNNRSIDKYQGVRTQEYTGDFLR